MPKLAAATPTPARIDVNMTPMIDVVFQLLTFFLMTFRVAAAEGDFELKLPRESVGIADSVNEQIVVRLLARPNGELGAVQVDALHVPGGVGVFARLNDRIATTVRNARNAGLSEIECLIEADDALHYQHVIQAVAAISARRNELGEVDPLIRKIKFPQAVQTEIVDR